MLDFTFFHQAICDRFTRFLLERNIDFQFEEADDYLNVSVSEDIDGSLIDEIEDLYDELLDESRDQVNSDEGESADSYQKASLLIALNNGETTYAHVDSAVLSRVLKAVSKEELNQLINAIAEAVENQDDRSYCQIVRDTGSLPSKP